MPYTARKDIDMSRECIASPHEVAYVFPPVGQVLCTNNRAET